MMGTHPRNSLGFSLSSSASTPSSCDRSPTSASYVLHEMSQYRGELYVRFRSLASCGNMLVRDLRRRKQPYKQEQEKQQQEQQEQQQQEQQQQAVAADAGVEAACT